jgi:hypothetical protein
MAEIFAPTLRAWKKQRMQEGGSVRQRLGKTAVLELRCHAWWSSPHHCADAVVVAALIPPHSPQPPPDLRQREEKELLCPTAVEGDMGEGDRDWGWWHGGSDSESSAAAQIAPASDEPRRRADLRARELC